MKKIIDGWKHLPGIHCGSVTLRDVMTYYGHEWSEQMCFGIGGGLGFYYTVNEKISPTRMIFVRGPSMEPSFFTNIGLDIGKWEHAPGNPLTLIKESIDNNTPVIIQTDIYYLEYYNSGTHFPGHIISVWGYDDEAGKVFVADNHFEGLQQIEYDKFIEGMASEDSSNPLDNNYIKPLISTDIKPLADIIPEALRFNARNMLNGMSGGRGESGVRKIREWSDDLPNWKDAPDWKWCARFGYQVIKKRGVGGAGFRWMYRDFLREAEEIVPGLKEFGLSASMDEIGSSWSDIAMLLKDISEKDYPDSKMLEQASSDAHEIWETETEFYNLVIDRV